MVSNSVAFGAGVVSFLLDAEDTGGDFSLLEIVARPGSEPPYHVHEREDETFHLLEGRVSIMADGEVFEVNPGETVFLPRGVPHTFRIRSEYARTLLTVTPSGFDGYFRAMGYPATSLEIPEPTPLPTFYFEKVARVSASFGIRIMPEQPKF